MVRPLGLEPRAYGLEGRRSILLSYRRTGIRKKIRRYSVIRRKGPEQAAARVLKRSCSVLGGVAGKVDTRTLARISCHWWCG